MQHDLVIDNGSGAVVLLDMNNALKALASCSSGAVEPPNPIAGMFWLDTSGGGDGYLRQRNRNNTGWQQVLGMPIIADAGDVLAAEGSYVTPKKVLQQRTAMRGYARNRIINPAMQVSQINGNTIGTVNNYYMADLWSMQLSPTGTVSAQRIAGSFGKYWLKMEVNTATPTLAATDMLGFRYAIEGQRIADFLWGTAGARRVILRFGFRGPAGTYSVALRNASVGRLYLKTFTITAAQADQDTIQTFVIPGDTTGTWPNDTGAGLYIGIYLAAGSNYSTGVDGWQTTSVTTFSAPGCSNGLADLGAVYYLSDVGLYLDLDGSGIPPPFQFPDEAVELMQCQRYWQQSYFLWDGNPTAASWLGQCSFMVDWRGTPTFTASYPGNSGGFAATATYIARGTRTVRTSCASSSSGTATYYQGYLSADARL